MKLSPLMMVLAILSVTSGAEAAAKAVVFDTYDGYFVSNKFEPEAPASFIVIQDQSRFDAVFGVAMVMGDKSHRLPANAFQTKIVLAAIKRGKALYRFKVQDVTDEGGVLSVRYTAASEAQPTAEFACPLILGVPKGDYSAVQFVEDGKLIKTIDLPRAGQPKTVARSAAAQVIVLKLDDVVGLPSPQWQRIIDYIEKGNLKASCGIICNSLEEDRPAYFKWINDVRKRGQIEFWLHGYKTRTSDDKAGEFELASFQEQQAVFEKSARLAREKLGFDLVAFGPHWSGTTEQTEQAVAAIPQLKIWFYGPKNSRYYKGFVFERVLTLENPTFVPDFEKFKAVYEKMAADKSVLALQGHPNQWDEKRWEGFVKIIEFLKSRNCVFMTASEYLESVSEKHK